MLKDYLASVAVSWMKNVFTFKRQVKFFLSLRRDNGRKLRAAKYEL